LENIRTAAFEVEPELAAAPDPAAVEIIGTRQPG
jgi:hypothetical protein